MLLQMFVIYQEVKMKRPSKRPQRPVGTICHDCAIQLGGQWPAGHLATVSMDIGPCSQKGCINAGKEISTCDASDWNWPGYCYHPEEREF